LIELLNFPEGKSHRSPSGAEAKESIYLWYIKQMGIPSFMADNNLDLYDQPSDACIR
jgi:hypothetical protein